MFSTNWLAMRRACSRRLRASSILATESSILATEWFGILNEFELF
jgi:hypothetical protein